METRATTKRREYQVRVQLEHAQRQKANLKEIEALKAQQLENEIQAQKELRDKVREEELEDALQQIKMIKEIAMFETQDFENEREVFEAQEFEDKIRTQKELRDKIVAQKMLDDFKEYQEYLDDICVNSTKRQKHQSEQERLIAELRSENKHLREIVANLGNFIGKYRV